MRSTVVTALICAALLMSCGADDGRVVTAGTSTASDDRLRTGGEPDLASVIITLDDLPSGWTQISAGRHRQPGDPPRTCVEMLFEELEVFLRDDRASAVAMFKRPGMLLNTVVVSGYAHAEQYLDELPAEADACDGSADGEGGTVSVLPLAFAALGDDTFATHMELHLPTTVTVLLAFTRVGDFVVMAYMLGTGGEDPALLDDVMRTMVGRL